MKMSVDKSKTNVCKEDVLMCIFKDVPNFLPEDDESGASEGTWVGGSYHEVLMGRQGSSMQSSESRETNLPTLTPLKDESKEEKVLQTIMQRSEEDLTEKKSSAELHLWSSPFESEECLPGALDKHNNKNKKKQKFKNCQWLLKSVMSSDSLWDKKLHKKYTDLDELCDECRWLVRAAKSSDSVMSEEDDDLIKSWMQSSLKQLSKKDSGIRAKDSLETMYVKSYHKNHVMKLLNEVQGCLLECSLLLTTHKLHKKLHKKTAAGELENDTPSDWDVLFDQIHDEEDSKDGASKLCLVLGKLVTRFLKTR